MKMKYKNIKKGLAATLLVGGTFMLVPSSQDVAAQAIGLRKLDQMLTPTPKTLARGKATYAVQCVECHGANGGGGGALSSNFDPAPAGFTQANYKYGGGPIQIFNVISRGELRGATTTEGADGPVTTPAIPHPAFPTLAYQDRWAVAHFVRSLGPTSALKDSAEDVKMAEYEAKNGVCNPSLKGAIAAKVKPTGEAQLALGKKIFSTTCTSCHGEKGAGDGAAAGALKPPPRNFTSKDQKWTNGTSPLAVFNTLSKGIEGTSMASYASLKEEERWALAHYIRTFVPKSALKDSTEKEVMDVCRSLSEPPKPQAITVARAMRALSADYQDERSREIASYGPALVYRDANPRLGQTVYTRSCSSCHGAAGAGSKAHGPYGSFPPYLYVQVGRLTPAMAGGTTQEFAARSVGGVHATLPDMTGASQMSATEWKALHVYVARFEGGGDVVLATEVPAVPSPPEGPVAPAVPKGSAPKPASVTP